MIKITNLITVKVVVSFVFIVATYLALPTVYSMVNRNENLQTRFYYPNYQHHYIRPNLFSPLNRHINQNVRYPWEYLYRSWNHPLNYGKQ